MTGSYWHSSGYLDLRPYQKPLATYLYIPMWSDHAPHILTAWIKGELIRYVKRSNQEVYFLDIRQAFAERLIRRGYNPQTLQPVFDSVSFTDRWKRLDLKPKPQSANDPTIGPVVCALTLPNAQRLSALGAQQALLSCSQIWLHENRSVPIEVRQLRFIVARRTVGKLSSLILNYRYHGTF